MSEPVRRVEIFTGAGRRRTWSAEAKAAIVAETLVPGTKVCAVARRHGLTPQQLFTWRRLAREAGVGAVERGSAFAAVVLEDALPGLIREPVIEVAVGDMTVRVPPGMDEASLTRVLRAVRAAL
jgi:transposase